MDYVQAKRSLTEEINAAIAGVQQGKLTSTELDYLNIYGGLHRNKLKVQEVPPEQLLFQA